MLRLPTPTWRKRFLVADVIVDDHLLLDLLLGDEPTELRPVGGRIWTTGLWYHRLCRALAVPSVEGRLSRKLGEVTPRVARGIVAAVVDLPEEIAMISLRTLAWPMGALLAEGVRLNLLSLEALAAAEHLGAELCLDTTDSNDPLRAAAEERQVPLRFVS